MKKGLLILITLIGSAIAVDFPDLDTFWNVNAQLLDAVASDSIPQRYGGGKGTNITTDELCTQLIHIHMEGFDTDTSEKLETNDGFLGIKAPWKKFGFKVISWDACIKALTQPYQHKNREWLDNYAGYHVGMKYKREVSGGEKQQELWYTTDRNGFQSVRHQKGTICGLECGCNPGECFWGWQYADLGGESPFIQRWNPASSSAREGMSLGFPIHFNYLGKSKAECIVWLNFKETCLQCFNRAKPRTRTTVACYNSYSQFEVMDEAPE